MLEFINIKMKFYFKILWLDMKFYLKMLWLDIRIFLAKVNLAYKQFIVARVNYKIKKSFPDV